MDEQRIDIIIKANNIANDYSFLKPNESQENALKDAYSSVLGKEALVKSLNFIGDPKPHISRWEQIFKDEIESLNIPSEKILALINRIEKESSRKWLLLFLVGISSERGEIDFAESLIPSLGDGDGYMASQCHANRIILKNLLNQIDLKEFKRRLKLCKPAKAPRIRIIEIKQEFVEKQSSKKGLEEAMKIVQDRLFGPEYLYYALVPETRRINISQMIDLIENQPLNTEGKYLKPRILVKYAESNPNLSKESFDLIFAEIEAIDKSYKLNGVRLRNLLLYHLGGSTQNLDWVKKCTKLTSDPFLKRELGYHKRNILAR